MSLNNTTLGNLYKERKGKTKRVSSYDRLGGNMDFYRIFANSTREIFNVSGKSGCITHIWVTMSDSNAKTPLSTDQTGDKYRGVVIKMYWDGEDTPSVEAPIGDFFGMGHGMTKTYWSAPLNMSPKDGRSFNCYFPMPYETSARIEIVNETNNGIQFFFYVDYEEYDEPIDSDLRFHARWNRMINKGIKHDYNDHHYYQFGGFNTTGRDNYVILEAKGKGHYVGCNMNFHNLLSTNRHNWYGEGDDMIFIDNEPWPPRLHGTGTEDFFNTAWCPTEEYSSPYHGIILGGGHNWSGKSTYYRYHIQDPIMFNEAIKVTIECGHNNHRSDDYSSTAYWYQAEPHMEYKPLPSIDDRLPLKPKKKFRLPFIDTRGLLDNILKMVLKDGRYNKLFEDYLNTKGKIK